MRVLIACEFSGTMRERFRARGHDAWSCDLLPSADNSPYHIQGDVLLLLRQWWDLVIAHPPCTRLTNAGVRWLTAPPGKLEADHYDATTQRQYAAMSEGQRLAFMWAEMRKGAEFFKACLNANAPRVAVENPVMHGYARAIVGRGPDFTVQPWQFGDNFKKRTCFWTRGLPALKRTCWTLDGSTAVAEVHNASPGPDRWKLRSVTYPGIANACAEQWG